MKNIFFLVNKTANTISYAGPMPETWGTITGLADINYDAGKDLTWAGYPAFGYLNEADIRATAVPVDQIESFKQAAQDVEWEHQSATRFDLIQAQRWRIDRFNDQTMLGIAPTEDIKPVLAYIEALRNITVTSPDPFNIVWPSVPVEAPYVAPA